jgi:hypothetical protein
MSTKRIPLLKCFPVYRGPYRTGLVTLWCPFCEAWHSHDDQGVTSRGRSHREAHCDAGSPFLVTNYDLRLITPEEIKRFGVRVLPGWKRGMTW